MKIVSFGDVHMATSNLERMGELWPHTDLIVISGDLTNFGGPEQALTVVEAARQRCPRVLAVPGNLDRPEVIPFLEREGMALHGRGVVTDGVGIFGCGASNYTPFHTPLEISEEEIYATLIQAYRQLNGHQPAVMVCHTPPYATKCDRLSNGTPVGSTAARRFIEEFQPPVCISGHIHESAGIDTIGRTTVFNAGPFKGGGYIVVDYDGRRLDARLEFL